MKYGLFFLEKRWEKSTQSFPEIALLRVPITERYGC